MHKSKNQPLPAVREEVPRLLTLNKFRSRCERGHFTQPNLAGLRRGLASNNDNGPVAAPQWGRSARTLLMPRQLRVLRRLPVGFP